MFVCSLILLPLLYLATEAYLDSNVHLEDLKRNISQQQVWHSYEFDSGVGNREELYIVKVAQSKNFLPTNGILKWETLLAQGETFIFGLGINFLIFTAYNSKNESLLQREEFNGTIKGFSTFQKWDSETQMVQSFLVVAISSETNSDVLKWFTIQNKQLKFLYDWPFHRNIYQMHVVKVNQELKMLIVSHLQEGHTKNAVLGVYNLNIAPHVDLWLFEQIQLIELPSSVTVFSENDDVFLTLAYPQTGLIHIWRYSKTLCKENLEQKNFKLHQKIHLNGLISHIAFRVGFKWQLAVASTKSSIYQMGDNLQFNAVTYFDFGNQIQWMYVPVDTYREDVILLSKSNAGISALIWNGNNNYQIIDKFDDFVCKNDANCMKSMDEVSLIDGTTFQYHGHQNILMPTKSGIPVLVKLLITLRPLPDKISLHLNEVMRIKETLQDMHTSQAAEIENLKVVTDTTPGNSAENLMTTSTGGSNLNIEAVSHTKNWSDVLLALDILKNRINILNRNIIELSNNSKFSLPEGSQLTGSANLFPQNISNGIVFHGKVVINNLNAVSLNGHSIKDVLQNSFRTNVGGKIGGTKTFENLKTENLAFDKVNDISGCNIVFSDDPWDALNGNVITGDVLWESKINILNDVTFLNGATQKDTRANNYRTLSNVPKHNFDDLHFQDLEITHDANVLSTINNRSIILPIHMIPLDPHYLETINQARVEQVNVKGNLDFELLNGKNFTDIVKQISLKSEPKSAKNISKIQGVLKVESLNAHKINCVPLSKPRSDSTAHSDGNEPHENRGRNEKLKSISPRFARKRNIYVFHDIDVNGIVNTNTINNLDWDILNGTLRKGENAVVKGHKIFGKALTSSNINVTGTMNNENFPQVVMTDFSDQTVKFPQIFSNASFNNLTLLGTWDGIDLVQLNRSLLRPDLEFLTGKTNLTISNGFTLLTEKFVATDYVNHASLMEGDTHDREEVTITAGHGLNLIKASKVIVNGSLKTNYNVNGMNLVTLNDMRVSLSQPQTVEQNISQDELIVDDDINLISLNDNNILSLVESDGDVNIIDNFLEGHLRRVKKLLVKGDITTIDGINGYHLSQLQENGINLANPDSIDGTVVFEDVAHFKQLNVTDSINGYSLKWLDEDIALKHSHIFLNGIKNFTTLRVLKNMKAKSLNGHQVQEIVTLQGDQAMKGSVTINGDVTVQGNLMTNGGLNEISIPSLLKTFSTQYNSYIIPGDLVLNGEEMVINNLFVSDDIQNISFDNMMKDVVYKRDCCDISGRKKFLGEVKLMENLLVENTINGLNVDELNPEDIALVSEPSKISGTLVIKEAILSVLNANGHFNSTRINNFDMNEWFEESIPLRHSEVVNGKMEFVEAEVAGNVEVNLINGHMSSAIIPLKGKQFIPVTGLFQRLNATSDISVGGYVNGVNLVQEMEKSVLLTKDQTINTKMIFYKDLVINGNLVVDRINGKSIKSIVTLDTEQVIENSLNFHGVVTVSGNIDRLKTLNDINLKNWYGRSVFPNREQEISGVWSVGGNLTAKNIYGEGSLNNFRLVDISKEVSKSKSIAIHRKVETEKEYNSQCHQIEQLSRELTKLPFMFHQFEVVHIIDTQLVIESVIPLQIAGSHYLIVTFLKECFSAMYQWEKENSTFRYLRHVNIGPVSKSLVAYRNGATYLVTSYSYSTVECNENRMPGNIWVFEDNSEKFVHLLTGTGFVDVMNENDTSDIFYTLEDKGAIYQWTITSDKNVEDVFLVDVGPGNYRFLDFKVTGGLAVSNGREIKEIKVTEKEVLLDTFTIPYGNMVALPINGKILVGLVLRDKILVYENFRAEKLFCVIPSYKAGSVLWFNYGVNKQAFLIVSSHHRLIEVFEYKSISGFVKRMSLQLFSVRLQSAALPSKGKYQLSKFVMVIQKNKVIFLEADMLGDFYEGSMSKY